jgi:hypothetical protein
VNLSIRHTLKACARDAAQIRGPASQRRVRMSEVSCIPDLSHEADGCIARLTRHIDYKRCHHASGKLSVVCAPQNILLLARKGPPRAKQVMVWGNFKLQRKWNITQCRVQEQAARHIDLAFCHGVILSVSPSNFPRACQVISADARSQDVYCAQWRYYTISHILSDHISRYSNTHTPRNRPSERSALGFLQKLLRILRILVGYERQTRHVRTPAQSSVTRRLSGGMHANMA